MTIFEFNQRTNANLTEEQYKPVEQMYINAGDMDKNQFCADWRKHSDSQLLQMFYSQTISLREEKAKLNETLLDLEEFLVDQAEKWSATDLREKAIKLMGLERYLTMKLQKGYNLWEADREAMIQILQNKK